MGGKKGFTLIELVVVMTLIAVLTVLSGGFLKDLYDNYRASQAAEELVGLIRDAQSKSMAAEGAKAYGVEVFAKRANDTATASKLEYTETNPAGSLRVSTPSPVDLGVTSIELDRSGILDCGLLGNRCSPADFASPITSGKSFVFNFSAPFGTPEYFYRDPIGTDGTNVYCQSPAAKPVTDYNPTNTASKFCGWIKNDNYLKNYSLFHVGASPTDTVIAGSVRGDATNTFYNQGAGTAKVKLTFNNVSRTVVVKGTGEAYIE